MPTPTDLELAPPRPSPAPHTDPRPRPTSHRPAPVAADDRWALWLAATVVAIAIACRLLGFAVPIFDWDEAAFGLSGQSLLAGHLPATAIFDNKPGGLVDLFALSQAVFGANVFALRIIGFAAALATAALVTHTARRAGASMASALVAAALFLAATLYQDGWASMSELVACPLIALANLVALRADWHAPRTCFAFGVLGGAAFQITYLVLPVFGLIGLTMIGLTMLTTTPARPATQRAAAHAITGALAAAAGFALVVLALWLPYLRHGTLGTYIAEQLAYNAAYRVPLPPLHQLLPVLVHNLWPLAVPLVASLASSGRPSPRAWAVAAGLAGALIAALGSNRLYAHYLLIALPSTTLLVALAMAHAHAPRRRAALAVTLAVAALLTAAAARQLAERLTAAPPHTNDPAVIAGMGLSDLDRRAARAVDALSRPDEAIFVYNESHAIYYFARRAPAARYVFLTHYLAESRGARTIIQPGTLLAQVLARRPRLLLIGHLVPSPIDADAMVRAAHYRPCARIDVPPRHLTIYCRP